MSYFHVTLSAENTFASSENLLALALFHALRLALALLGLARQLLDDLD